MKQADLLRRFCGIWASGNDGGLVLMPRLKLLLKHQAGALVSTSVDLGTMSLLVELGLLAPEGATAVGAALGAVCNFTLGRRWIFVARHARVGPQAFRYGLVSLASLGLNTVGEAVLYRWAGVQYFAARLLVSLLVSLCWNYPMQRGFVFRSAPPLGRVP